MKNTFKVVLQYLFNVFIQFNTVYYLKLSSILKIDPNTCTFKNLYETLKTWRKLAKNLDKPDHMSTYCNIRTQVIIKLLTQALKSNLVFCLFLLFLSCKVIRISYLIKCFCELINIFFYELSKRFVKPESFQAYFIGFTRVWFASYRKTDY